MLPTHPATVDITGGLFSRFRSASRNTACPTPSSCRNTVPGGCSRPPSSPSRRRRRSASRANRRRYASSSRTVSKVLVADDAADITAATTTAVSGSTEPRPSGIKLMAISSIEPFSTKTSSPSTSAGSNSIARTSNGHTSALSRPNAPAPLAAVIAIRVALSPVPDFSRKSGRTPASASMVSVDTAHTAVTRSTAPPTVFHRGFCTPGPRFTSRPAPRARTEPQRCTAEPGPGGRQVTGIGPFRLRRLRVRGLWVRRVRVVRRSRCLEHRRGWGRVRAVAG